MSVFFRRKLPHYHLPNATYFITFRLADSLPVEVIKRLQEDYEREKRALSNRHQGKTLQEERYLAQERYFARFDTLLDRAENGPHWLSKPRFAEIVAREIQALDPEYCHLHVYCLMSNHVHLLIDQQGIQEPPPLRDGKHYSALSHAMRLLKGRSGYACAKLLERKGAFWQHENYDRVVRNEKEFEQGWPFTYVNPDL